MGSSPSAPTVVMPSQTAPTMYQSVTPLESYKDVAEAMSRAKRELANVQEQRYQETGTPAEIGARQAGIRAQEAANYLASIPGSDRYLEQVTGVEDPFRTGRVSARKNLSAAQKQYAKALENIDKKPAPPINETPSWATRTVTGIKTPT